MRVVDWAESYVNYLDVTPKYLLLVVRRFFPDISGRTDVVLSRTPVYTLKMDTGAQELRLDPYHTPLIDMRMAYHPASNTLVVLDERGQSPWDALLTNLIEGNDALSA